MPKESERFWMQRVPQCIGSSGGGGGGGCALVSVSRQSFVQDVSLEKPTEMFCFNKPFTSKRLLMGMLKM